MVRLGRPCRLLFAALVLGVCLATSVFTAFTAELREVKSLRVAVYNVPPYGYVDSDGSMSGASVDLWRRVAGEMEWHYQLIPISDMEEILSGLEQGRFDAAIGAITITPERAARVDFSYPAHRSGVAIAVKKETGPIFALVSYGTAVSELALGRYHAGDADFDRHRHVDGRAACPARKSGIGIFGRQLARRPLLGGRHHDHRGIRRQDTENAARARRRRVVDDQQLGIGFAVIDQSGIAIDG
jgi:hypothetical protein